MRARSVVAAVGWIVPFIAFGIVRARVALAEPVTPPPATAPAAPETFTPPPWSLSTGIGFVPLMGGLGAAAIPIGAFVTLERRLVGPLSAMARFSGSVGHSTSDAQAGSGYGPESTSAIARGGLGLKVSFGSRDVLEVSPFAMVHASYAWSGAGDFTAESSTVGGELGVALDRDIVENFGIRLSAVIASADRGWSRVDYPSNDDGSVVTSRSSGTDFQLGLAPAAELRWSF